ncbi:MAG TPA: M20/M25/M40 family metallo-hydrolase [Candidatus Heimdallarchaeota archaeon]|nr:M20/M25/M40 family metallo-hydrolase [Candidatus Heimdallarchaeota archaeon]
MKIKRFFPVCLVLAILLFSIAWTQENVNEAMVSRIWEEEINHSQVMEIVSYLSDVLGPRIPGSPEIGKAYQWTGEKFKEWGMSNVAIEPCGKFGPGWSNKYISVHLISPSYQPMIAYPVPWTKGTEGKIKGQPLYVQIETSADLEKYRGKLKGAIILTKPPRKTPPVFTPSAVRMTDDDLKKLAETPIPIRPEKKEESKEELSWAEREDFFRSEGVGVLIEPSDARRSDYGTVRVDAYDGDGMNHKRRDQNPRVVMAAEHYARIFRIMNHNVQVEIEIEVINEFYEENLQIYNVVAEIPGTDKKEELVMLGAHIDSWAAGTGAADNAAGCAVVMEAMRILKKLGIKPRRTIRAALWSAEEQGYYGSRSYISKHFGDTDAKKLENPDWDGSEESWRNPLEGSNNLVLKPDYDNFSGYFNYDNGSGKILGIYLQENFAVRPIFEEWIKPLIALGVTTLAQQSTDETDHVPFDWIGLPAFQFIQDEIDYGTKIHHTNQDVYDHCIPEDLIQSAIVMASFVYHAAMREEKLPRKPMPLPRTSK